MGYEKNPVRSGILVVNKDAGMTSHDVVDEVRRITGIRKAGHTGTLDPMATGVLIICVGQATRLADYLQGGTKVYKARVRFGISTDTDDAAGKVTKRASCQLEGNQVESILPKFSGDILQAPPMASAISVDGTKLYKLARKGIIIDRPVRRVRVDSIRLESFSDGEEPEAELTVVCGKGTYIRSLARDIGSELGCPAHLEALERTENAGFRLSEAHTLDEIEAAASRADLGRLIISPDRALSFLAEVQVLPEVDKRIRNGCLLAVDEVVSGQLPQGVFRVKMGAGLLALYLKEPEASEARPLVVLAAQSDSG